MKRKGSALRSNAGGVAPRWHGKLPWLIVTGSILIFGSWVLQNYFGNQASGEISYLENTQLLVAVEENRMNQWEICLLKEHKREQPDTNLLASYALKRVQASLNLLGWTEARVLEEDSSKARIIKQKNAVKDSAVAYYRRREIHSLLALDSAVAVVSDAATEPLLQEFARRLSRLYIKEKSSNSLFLAAYILGSLFLGLGFITRWLAK